MPLLLSWEEPRATEAINISPLTRRRESGNSGIGNSRKEPARRKMPLFPLVSVLHYERQGRLFDYQATGDPVTGVTRRIGFHVIGLCVNHQRSSAISEKGSSA